MSEIKDMAKKRKILIVDDEADIRDMVEQLLAEQFTVLKAPDGEAGFKVARAELPDLIILDISMPKLDGFGLCEQLRTNASTRDIPIIMLTVSTDVDVRTKSFLTGADDFVPKPFQPKEFVARVQSKIRRLEERQGNAERIECGNLVLDMKRLDALLNGRSLGLSVLEFNLLKCFVENKERVMSRERILEAVWRDAIVTDRTVDTHIVSLRKRLEGFDYTIATVYGAGYVLKKES